MYPVYSMELLLLSSGVILAGTASLLALRLIPLTGKLKQGLLLSAVPILLMLTGLYQLLVYSGVLAAGRLDHVIAIDALAVVMGTLLLAFIISSRAMYREHHAAQEWLEEQVRALQSSLARTEMTGDGLAAYGALAYAGKDRRDTLPLLKYIELMRHQNALAEHDWLLAFDAVTDPIVLYDRTYRVIRANHAYTDRAGMALKDIIGKPYFQVFPKLGRPIVDPSENIEQGVARSELRLETGEVFLSKNFPVYNEANEYRHTLHIFEDVTQIKQSEKAVRRTRLALKVVASCTREMLQANDESQMLQTVCRVAVESGAYRLAWVGQAEQDKNKTVSPIASYADKNHLISLPHATWDDTDAGHGPIGMAIRTGKTCVANDLIHDPKFRFWHGYATKNHLAAAVGLPLHSGKSVWGGLVLCSVEPLSFSAEEVAVLEVLSASLAFGVSAARIRAENMTSVQSSTLRFDGLKNNLEKIIVAMEVAIEKHHDYSIDHSRIVGEIGMRIALEMGLPEEQAYGVRLAGILHDVGEVQIPEEIFCKTGQLTADERMQAEGHTQAGHDIFSGLDLPWPLAKTVLQHHERLDGSGYPNGLKGDDILLEAKIIAVADTFSAIAYQRQNHPRLGIPAALAELERNKGKLFDGVFVDAALKLFREKGYGVSHPSMHSSPARHAPVEVTQ
jgi:HD-GYP domain-containing protein (c-di-GMP phosphodiesterase class II)